MSIYVLGTALVLDIITPKRRAWLHKKPMKCRNNYATKFVDSSKTMRTKEVVELN